MNKLTKKEQKFLNIMESQSATLFLEGRSGEGKTALMYSIAKKAGYKMVDIRLASADETDLGLYPVLTDGENGIKVVSSAVPEWAYEANKQKTLIFFDELNRAPLANRNAALQILNERQINSFFRFNDDVIFAAAGNIGEEDNNDVEEMDAAMWGRIAHVRYILKLDDWLEDFANDNVWSVIRAYLTNKPEEVYKMNENSKAYQSYRSWTNLSKFLVRSFMNTNEFKRYIEDKNIEASDSEGLTYLEKQSIKSVMEVVKDSGIHFIGSGTSGFLRYLENMTIVSINDVLDRFSQVEVQLKTFNRSRLGELLSSLQEFEVEEFSTRRINNVIKFLGLMDDDPVMGYFAYILDNQEYETNGEKIFAAFPKQKKLLDKKYKINT
jgi:hypothetical protein